MAGFPDNKMGRLKVSLCLIALNEADNLKRCFQHIGSIVDEILVLDTGSTDGTLDIARQLGAKVFAYKWDDHFGNARTYLLKEAKNDWVLWIDGDEYYPLKLTNEIQNVIKSNKEYVGYYIPRRNYYFGKWLRYGGNYPDYQLKMFKKSAASVYKNRIHERIRLNGKTGYFSNYCEHYTYPTIDTYIQKNIKYSTLEAQRLYEKGVRANCVNSIKWLFIKPLFRFIKRYLLKAGFLNGRLGLFAAIFDAWGYIFRYVKLWEVQKNKTNKN